MSSNKTWRIGVDGGGTSCRAALVGAGQRFTATGGSANVSSDFERAIGVMQALLADLAAQAGRDTLRDLPGHFGLAGVMTPDMGTAVAQALHLPRVTVGDDHATTTVGALGDADGAVAAIGTGSFLGRQAGSVTTAIGGWGFHIGDQASGAWLGRRVLEQVLLVQDGLAPASPLITTIAASDFGPGGIVAFSFRASPGDYARFAPQIVGAADTDPFAASLMHAGAAYIRAGISALGWITGDPLCLTGGLGPAYGRWLDIPTTAPKGSALDGALILAGRT